MGSVGNSIGCSPPPIKLFAVSATPLKRDALGVLGVDGVPTGSSVTFLTAAAATAAAAATIAAPATVAQQQLWQQNRK